MIRYLSLSEVIHLQNLIVQQSGGASGIRDESAIESAIAQPQMTFGGDDLYKSISEKAAVLGFSLIQNHAFVDGNKRIGHAATEVFLMMNGYEIVSTVDEQEEIIISIASGDLGREEFADWLEADIEPFQKDEKSS